ncbi:hypothetical protein M427DRAFT_131440 [Gonapodya prolifera JEL478]|uniref:Uncharacterized protein n=1 Tax=Gonapodya prolifera (strain JEL478) TaxID=1344416 RepID=A0A139ATE1_GONPJ|nr:hypothetical protein M427DRAFT_131440 [Gonapodya prolifera JEL478]|eukprot:KXS19992.1 hypothetical protein M427DRAFT_131440 [Gonapodya prolifera JEL478]
MGNSLIFELENLNVDTTALEDVVHHMESATWWRVSEAARIANKIDLEQRSALEKPIIHINSSLEPLCYNATFQHGKGMYEKMKNIMVQGVSQSNMFDKGTGEVIAILDNAREAMESELAAFCEGETRRLRMAVGPLLEGSDRPKIPYEVQQTILSRLEKFSKALGDMERKYSLDAEGDGDATEGALVARSA